jgi:hypothetical protein
MNTSKKNSVKLNCLLTRIIIKLHEKGYSEDFIKVDGEKYVCVQCNGEFFTSNLQIKVFNLAFDHSSGCYKYVHTIETHSGLKGVFISDSLHSNPVLIQIDNKTMDTLEIKKSRLGLIINQ